VCPHEHVEEVAADGHESIWKRRAREAAEAEADITPTEALPPTP
jgi:hypothetical protein